jgi:uncharacterized RDD family membrane protein YckC
VGVIDQNASHSNADLPYFPGYEQWTGAAVSEALLYAGFWRRVCARFIDVVLIAVGYFLGRIVIFAPRYEIWETLPRSELLFLCMIMAYPIYLVALPLFYYALFEASPLQATPGKLALGLQVTSLAGDRISLAQGLIRSLMRVFSDAVWLLFLAQLWTVRRQALHDLISRSLVVDSRWTAGETIATALGERPTGSGHPVWRVVLARTALVAAFGLSTFSVALLSPKRYEKYDAFVAASTSDSYIHSSWPYLPTRTLVAKESYFSRESYWLDNLSFDSSYAINSYKERTPDFQFAASITRTGIVFSGGGEPLYHAIPVIANGQFRLTEIKSFDSDVVEGSIVNVDRFRTVFERRVNQALAVRNVRATAIELHDGYFRIFLERP